MCTYTHTHSFLPLILHVWPSAAGQTRPAQICCCQCVYWPYQTILCKGTFVSDLFCVFWPISPKKKKKLKHLQLFSYLNVVFLNTYTRYLFYHLLFVKAHSEGWDFHYTLSTVASNTYLQAFRRGLDGGKSSASVV